MATLSSQPHKTRIPHRPLAVAFKRYTSTMKLSEPSRLLHQSR